MPVAAATRCPQCHRPVGDEELACGLCGLLLRRASGAPIADVVGLPPPPPPPLRGSPFTPPPTASFVADPTLDEHAAGRVGGLPTPWFFLALGALLAPLLTFTPILRYAGWFLGSLCHESGHAAMGWFLGCPSVPAIRLDGHAAAIHQEQSKLLCAIVLGGFAGLAWRDRASSGRRTLWLALLALYPVLAFTDAREAAFLFAGHLGELALATYFLSRAVSGGFTGSAAERATHAMVGWFLVGRNAWLAGGLLWKESVRDWYAESGSFGLVNDYLRIAREVFGSSLSVPATAMLVASLLVLPAALWLGGRVEG